MRSIALLIAASLLSISMKAQNTTYEIGTQLAHLELGSGWQTDTRSAEDDAVRFAKASRRLFGRSDMRCWVRELRGIYENESDYGRLLDSQSEAGQGLPVQLTEQPDWLVASRRIEPEVDGRKLSYRSELLVCEGLAYHVMSWAERNDRAFLDRCAEELLDGFAFPNNDSEWRQGLQPEPRIIRAWQTRFQLMASPALWQKQKHTHALECLRLQSHDRQHTVTAHTIPGKHSPQRWLDRELETLQNWQPSCQEHLRRKLDLNGMEAHMLVSTTETMCMHSVLLPQSTGAALLVRYFAPGSAADARPIRDAMLASLKRLPDAAATPLTLPAIAKQHEPASTAPTRLSEFLATASQLGNFPGHVVHSTPLPDGTVIARDWQTTHHFVGDQREVVLRSPGYTIHEVGRTSEQWFAVSNDQVLPLVNGGIVKKPWCQARFAIGDGADLLLIRAREATSLGLSADGSHTCELQLLRRTASGEELAICDLPPISIQQVTLNHARNQIAICSPGSHSLDPADANSLVWQVSLADGNCIALGSWQDVRHVAPAADGWLVNGRPEHGPIGIWLVRETGKPEALITGAGLHAVKATSTHLTLFAPMQDQQQRLLRVSLADCRRIGRTCQPFGPQELHVIEERLLAASDHSLAPTSAAEIRSAYARADADAQTLFGNSLPTRPGDIDHLLGTLTQANTLGRDTSCRALLALLAANAMLQLDGEWVEAHQPLSWADYRVRSAQTSAHPYAVVTQPNNFVADWLEAGDSDPMGLATIAEQARGAQMLFGMDSTSLTARTREIADNGLELALRSHDFHTVRQVLLAASGNVGLRQRVYERLAAQQERAMLQEFAEEFAAGKHADAIDVLVHLNVRMQLVLSPTDYGRLFDEAMAAAERFPAEERLYLLLGKLAEQAFPQERDIARQCYQRVCDMAPYTWAENVAKRALTTLD